MELGAHTGVGTCFLAAGLEHAGGAVLWAVDTFAGTTTLDFEKEKRAAQDAGPGWRHLPMFRRHLAMFGFEDLVVEKVGWTTEVAKLWPGDPIGLLLVDADHSYDSCRADFLAWEAFLADGAVVMFHDYEPNYPGVIQAVDELLDTARLRLVETVCTLKVCRYCKVGVETDSATQTRAGSWAS